MRCGNRTSCCHPSSLSCSPGTMCMEGNKVRPSFQAPTTCLQADCEITCMQLFKRFAAFLNALHTDCVAACGHWCQLASPQPNTLPHVHALPISFCTCCFTTLQSQKTCPMCDRVCRASQLLAFNAMACCYMPYICPRTASGLTLQQCRP